MRKIGVAVVLALIVAGCGSSSPAAHTTTKTVTQTNTTATTGTGVTTTSTAASVPAGGPVPTGFEPSSFTAISDTNWWLIGQAPCSVKPCTSIVRTENGGVSFVGLPAPRTSQVSQIRFANARVGYAFDPELWMTTDGGESWTQLRAPQQVTDLEISGGYAYAVTAIGNDQSILERFPVGSSVGDTLPGAGHPIGGLWVQGSTVIVDSDASEGNAMEISDNNGDTFKSVAPPPSVACNFEAPDPAVIWADCATGTLSAVSYSTDGGAHWISTANNAVEKEMQGGEPNSAAFGAASGTTAVYGYDQLFRIADRGKTWAELSKAPGITDWNYVAFTDPLHGVALGEYGANGERLYYTTDGGLSYHLISIN
jgi:photosystem II stability/assembly factor-like uncharacterized protein